MKLSKFPILIEPRGKELSHMNFIENHKRSKSEIQQNFLSFLKKDAKHLPMQKIKEIKKTPSDMVHEYDKRFKDILNQIPYTIDEQLLIQWFFCRTTS